MATFNCRSLFLSDDLLRLSSDIVGNDTAIETTIGEHINHLVYFRNIQCNANENMRVTDVFYIPKYESN